MVSVTVFRGHQFDGGDELDEYDFPAVPRIGDTISLHDFDRSTFEEVTAVNFHVGSDGPKVRVLVRPKASGGMRKVPLGGI